MHQYFDPIGRSKLAPLDIVVFHSFLSCGSSIHMGVMIEGERFVHCQQNTGVIISRLSDQLFSRRIRGFFRFKKSEPAM